MPKKTIIIIRNAAATDFGGGERFPVFLSQALSSSGYDPIIVSKSTKLLSFAKENNTNVVKGWWWSKQNWSGMQALLIPTYVVWQLILVIYYLRLFKQLKPLAVHIQSKDDFIAATFAAKLMGIYVLWTDHADLKHILRNTDRPLKNPLGKLVLIAANLTNNITVVSASEYKLVSINIKHRPKIIEKVQVIYNGVFDSHPNYLTIKEKGKSSIIFTVASRLVIDKGIGEAIDAFNELQKLKNADLTLQILGDGPDSDRFKKQSVDNKSIVFLGHTSSPLDYMKDTDVFIHPTYHEGFSVALVEAGMLGLPIIATNVGGNPEIIENLVTGLLVPSKDTAALTKAMQRLIENKQLRSRLGRNARTQYEKRFNLQSIVDKEFIPLYEKGVK